MKKRRFFAEIAGYGGVVWLVWREPMRKSRVLTVGGAIFMAGYVQNEHGDRPLPGIGTTEV
jgi:hypothetical protein